MKNRYLNSMVPTFVLRHYKKNKVPWAFATAGSPGLLFYHELSLDGAVLWIGFVFIWHAVY